MNIFVPSELKDTPDGPVSCADTSNASVKEQVDTSKPVVHAYSFTLSELKPVTNIFVPSELKAIPVVCVSCPDTEKASVKEQVDTSKPVVHAYSFMSSPIAPATNIFVPSELKTAFLGFVSCPDTSNASTKVVAAYASLIGANPMEQIIAKNVRNLILEYFM